MVEVPQDRFRTFLLTITLGLTTLAFIITKTGRDALFFQGSSGLLQLPLIYINIAGGSVPLGAVRNYVALERNGQLPRSHLPNV